MLLRKGSYSPEITSNAAATVDPQTGKYVVAFEFDRKGAKVCKGYNRKHLPKTCNIIR